jgi:hypothetical protein
MLRHAAVVVAVTIAVVSSFEADDDRRSIAAFAMA